MKDIFTSRRFKLIASIIALLLVGALIAAANGRGETVQSSVIGTVFAPCHYVAQKISNSLDRVSKNAKGNAQYEKEIASLNEEIGNLRSQLADYENLKTQNELYKEFLELKEENKDYKFCEASIIGRDSADIYKSFTISKGLVSGVKKGNAVLYGKYIIGVVDKTYPDYSVVKTILDADSNISAYEILSNEVSYVTGNAKLAKNGKCKMANLSSSTDISYGSIICTAGIGAKIPKGLIIGTVDEIADEATDISSYAVVSPGADIDDITSCVVLTGFGD